MNTRLPCGSSAPFQAGIDNLTDVNQPGSSNGNIIDVLPDGDSSMDTITQLDDTNSATVNQ